MIKNQQPPAEFFQRPNSAHLSGASGFDFLIRVRRSAANVLGDSLTGQEVAELCDQHQAARELLLEDRGRGLLVVAAVGPSGQGKSWLVDQMTGCGSKAADLSRKESVPAENLTWFGPNPPADFDPVREEYRHCKAGDMESIGTPYLMLDAPGSTDDRPAVSKLASRALSLASVLLVVIRADQLRSQAVGVLAEATEGTIVVPVINGIRERSSDATSDIEVLITRIRDLAPKSVITGPVLIDDFELVEESEESVGNKAAMAVASAIESQLGAAWEGDRRRATRLALLDRRFRNSLHSVIGDQLPGLTSAVHRLKAEATRIPIEIAESLVGRGGPLQAAIRSRLRLIFLTETAAFWFPYRSLLGVLNLTHGAWDRMLISLSGSLPSLVGAMWASAKGRQADVSAISEVREGLQRHSEVAVSERLGPLADRFREELSELRKENGLANDSTENVAHSHGATLSGIKTLQSESQRIFDTEVERVSMNRLLSTALAILGTFTFWALIAGPIVALYREYLVVSISVFSPGTIRSATLPVDGALANFPTPSTSMLFASLFLSILPTAIFAMLVLAFCQRRRRVLLAEHQVRERHHDVIAELQRSGVLKLKWEDPLLSDAEFLLTAGVAEPEERE